MRYRILELFLYPVTHNKIHIYPYKYRVCDDDHFFYGKMCYAFDELDRSVGFSMDKDIECCIDDSYGIRFLLQFSSYDFIKRFLSEVENWNKWFEKLEEKIKGLLWKIMMFIAVHPQVLACGWRKSEKSIIDCKLASCF